MLDGIKIIFQNNLKIKTIRFIPVDVVRFATMPVDFDKTSIKTKQTNFSHNMIGQTKWVHISPRFMTNLKL